MQCLLMLLTSLLLVATSAYGDPQYYTQPEKLKEGLAAMREGDKAKAWEVMFPLAQAGDVQSMFYLGEMMLRSPEYGDNLERATKFFTVAAAKGHAGAKEQLERVKQMIAQKSQQGVTTIAGLNGLPSKAELDRANSQLAKYKADVLRFTDNMVETPAIPRIEVMVFIAKADSTAESLYRMTQSLESRFGNKIKTQFFIVINPNTWRQDSPAGGTNLPPNGFTPDFKGQLAAQHGVRKLPSAVVLPPSGQATVVDDLSSLSNLISGLL